MKNMDNSNITVFLDDITKKQKEKFDDVLENIFHSISPDYIKFSNIQKESNQYILYYQNRKYPFKFLSEQNYIQKVDKEILLDVEKREYYGVIRTLKLAGSMDLVDPKVIIGSHKTFVISSIISYIENGKEMIIDYGNNLIMEKLDYYNLFDMNEINTISKYELYLLYWYRLNLNNKNIIEGLFFIKEIIKDLSKNFPLLGNKYNHIGINKSNISIWGDKSDRIFHDSIDNKNRPYSDILEKLDSFTINPTKFPPYIKKLDEVNHYQFLSNEFSDFSFGLISNLTNQDRLIQELLSEKRYGKCHKNIQKIMAILDALGYEDHFVTSGLIAKNDQDSYFHSWIELQLENKRTLVLDYNHNLIMDKDKYYQLYKVKMINKIESKKLMDIIHYCIDISIVFSDRTINYLGEEINHDFKKNEQIFIKK